MDLLLGLAWKAFQIASLNVEISSGVQSACIIASLEAILQAEVQASTLHLPFDLLAKDFYFYFYFYS
jgi:hypothetical protein